MTPAPAKSRPGGRTSRVGEAIKAAAHAELVEHGYEGLSYRRIAQRAGVNASTVHRRWPTRARLIAHLLLDIADTQVKVPDTGRLASDLAAYLRQVADALTDATIRRQVLALCAAGTSGDPEVTDALRAAWDKRFTGAYLMLERAILRGELPEDCDRHRIIELLVAPVWFRVLVSHRPSDDGFIARCVADAIPGRSPC